MTCAVGFIAPGLLRHTRCRTSVPAIWEFDYKESGGRHEQVVATTHAQALEQLADELLNQYEIRYVQPDGVKPNEKLSVSSRRKDVTVHAPSRLPN
jgi:hypothetical protein